MSILLEKSSQLALILTKDFGELRAEKTFNWGKKTFSIERQKTNNQRGTPNK